MNEKILVVDDEKEIADLIEVYLKNDGYTVYKCYSGAEALRYIEETELDLAILDIMLPDVDGFHICSRIREKYFYPVIMLTAKVEDSDKIMGLTLGADDYITKPFSLAALVSKVGALLKRFPAEQPKTIVSGNITLYPEEKRAAKNGENLVLTAREYSLLAFFMENPMKVLSRGQLLESIWDIEGNFVDENTLSVNIRRLREKIEDNPSAPAILKNIRGLGYIWERKCEKR